eukprot:COSAG02_NODE_12917_length_1472_cov_1.371449_2_plen_225_part_00
MAPKPAPVVRKSVRRTSGAHLEKSVSARWRWRGATGDPRSNQFPNCGCVVCIAELWGRAESFIASMQRELPSLERPRWLPLVPRASARVVASVQVADTQAPIRIRHDAGANSNTAPEPEPEPDPRLAPTGNNRSKLHFHTMPGTWAMGCWGAAPEGYCWCALWTRHTVSVRTAVRIQSHLPLHDMDQGHCDLPVARMFVAPRVGSNIRAHRSLVDHLIFGTSCW